MLDPLCNKDGDERIHSTQLINCLLGCEASTQTNKTTKAVFLNMAHGNQAQPAHVIIRHYYMVFGLSPNLSTRGFIIDPKALAGGLITVYNHAGIIFPVHCLLM